MECHTGFDHCSFISDPDFFGCVQRHQFEAKIQSYVGRTYQNYTISTTGNLTEHDGLEARISIRTWQLLLVPTFNFRGVYPTSFREKLKRKN